MLKLVGERSSGKTKKLLEFAKENNAVVVCDDIDKMKERALEYGIVGLDFIDYWGYSDYHRSMDEKFVIDDVDKFLSYLGKVIGFSVSE